MVQLNRYTSQTAWGLADNHSWEYGTSNSNHSTMCFNFKSPETPLQSQN